MKLETLIRWHRQQAFREGQEYSREGWTKTQARDKLQRVRIHNQTADALEELDRLQRMVVTLVPVDEPTAAFQRNLQDRLDNAKRLRDDLKAATPTGKTTHQ